MKLDRNQLFQLYTQWVDRVADDIPEKTIFFPSEIVNAIANIIEANPPLIELPSDAEIGEIAQWVINNRYSKHLSEDGLSKVSDFEMYHHIIKLIKEQILNQNK